MNLSVRDYRPADFSQVMKIWEDTGMGGRERGDNHQTIETTLSLGGKFLILEDSTNKQMIGTAWLTFDGRRFTFTILELLQHFNRKDIPIS